YHFPVGPTHTRPHPSYAHSCRKTRTVVPGSAKAYIYSLPTRLPWLKIQIPLSPLVLLPASLSPRPPVEKISPSTPREGFVLETGPGSARECMAVSLLANDVSDLCIGKPAVRSLPLSAAAGDL
uniref:Uncharacterized protein n=1 Tax=Aegilops tauschii subsp. strangulata TaxID=200361 RepID=A0A452YK89_AEGTS